ncbi:MAG: AEC family transporter [Luteolibacter sp.]|uniref:AEC family transporter n=1 Tax=Luteolibacter sp. TaxID=1962973 RepID=UPI003266ED42
MFFQLFLNVCAPIFLIVGLGWLLDRKFHLHLESLVKLNIYLMVPAFIFTHVLDTELAGREALRIVAFTLSTIVLMFIGSAIAAKIFKMHGRQRQSLSLATMFYNCGNYGLPLVTLAFGHQAAAVQIYVLATMNVSTYTIGLFLAQSHGESAGSHRKALNKVLRQPTIYALLAGVICKTFAVPVKEVIWLSQPLDLLQSGLIGFALVTLGVQMSQTKPAPFRAPLWSAIALRLVIAPILAAPLALALGFSKDASASLILAAAAPTAVNTALLAHEFGGDISFSTSAVYYSTLFSMFTTTVLLYILKLWL